MSGIPPVSKGGCGYGRASIQSLRGARRVAQSFPPVFRGPERIALSERNNRGSFDGSERFRLHSDPEYIPSIARA